MSLMNPNYYLSIHYPNVLPEWSSYPNLNGYFTQKCAHPHFVPNLCNTEEDILKNVFDHIIKSQLGLTQHWIALKSYRFRTTRGGVNGCALRSVMLQQQRSTLNLSLRKITVAQNTKKKRPWESGTEREREKRERVLIQHRRARENQGWTEGVKRLTTAQSTNKGRWKGG